MTSGGTGCANPRAKKTRGAKLNQRFSIRPGGPPRTALNRRTRGSGASGHANEFRAAACQAEPDRPAPVLHHQREPGEAEPVYEAFNDRAMLAGREMVARCCAGHAVAGIVGSNAAELVAEPGDNLPVQKRPGRVAMQEQHRLAGPLIDIVDAGFVEVNKPVLDREKIMRYRERQHHALLA